MKLPEGKSLGSFFVNFHKNLLLFYVVFCTLYMKAFLRNTKVMKAGAP